MTLSEAYDEIMERIEVTEDMRRRIMVRMRTADLSGKPKVIPFSSWKRYAALAACLAVVLIGALAGPKLLHPPASENPPVQGENGIVECTGADELSKAVGVPVSEVKTLPFKTTQTEYLSYWGEMAEITYTGANDESAVYRISKGTEDNSGDYNTYPATETITVGSLSVELKGSEGSYTLACWTDGTYAYSLNLSDGVDASAWDTIITHAN